MTKSKKVNIKSKPAEKEFNFSQAFMELEKIARDFESEAVDLDEGLKKFEKGLELAAMLKARLKDAENRVKIISDKFAKENKSGDDA